MGADHSCCLNALGALCDPVTCKKTITRTTELGYDLVLADVVPLVEAARRASARAVNTVMTAACWTFGRRVVEQEQHGMTRARYGEALIDRLAQDLTARSCRGFGKRNLFQWRPCPRPPPGKCASASCATRRRT